LHPSTQSSHHKRQTSSVLEDLNFPNSTKYKGSPYLISYGKAFKKKKNIPKCPPVAVKVVDVIDSVAEEEDNAAVKVQYKSSFSKYMYIDRKPKLAKSLVVGGEYSQQNNLNFRLNYIAENHLFKQVQEVKSALVGFAIRTYLKNKTRI
jgi:hypothetical protein